MDIEKCLKAIYEKLGKPVLFFDCETTGLDVSNDDIIQIYACTYGPLGFTEREMFFNTKRTIATEALEKHGFGPEFLADYNYMEDVAQELWEIFDNDAVLCGYNHINFDIPILIENLLRNGVSDAVKLLKRETIDVYQEYKKTHSNELEVVFRRVTGEDMGNAHNAKDDIYATGRILEELMKEFEISPEKSDKVDLGGFFQVIDGKVAFAKGKYKNKLIRDLKHGEVMGYLDWMLGNDGISSHTKAISMKLKQKLYAEQEA